MNLIAQLLPLSNVIVGLDADSKSSIFEQVGLLFENNLHIARNQVFDSLSIREKLGSTGLGHGVAIPHGRIKELHQAAAALIRMKKPIPFDAPDGEPVCLLCVLLVPEKAINEHLEILSELAQMFSNKNFRESLLASRDSTEMYRGVYNWTPNVQH